MRTDPTLAGNLEAVAQCLEDEYQALLAEDHARLELVLQQKERLLADLAQTPGLGLGAAQGARAAGNAPWRRAIERVRALNNRNALALVPRAASNRARLHFLQSALGRAAVYAADGSVAPMHVRAAYGPGV